VYLKEQKSVSPQEFDEVASRNQAAEARLAEARAALEQAEAGSAQAQSHEQAVASVASYARIVAPFDGRVLRRTVDPGSLASPGVPLFVVEDPSRYQLEVTLPADVLRKVHQGTTARVELDALRGRELRGTVAEMEAGANPVSHTARARLSLPEEPGVQSGLFGRAFFVQGEKRALVVPQSSLLVRGQLRGIYVVDRDGVAHWRVLTLGRTRDDQVEVLSGLDEGDVIVLNPETEDLDGRKISGVLDRSREARS